jgi:HEAT repeat protein
MVKSGRPIGDLGLIAADMSLDWLQKYADPQSEISSDAMAAIAVHKGARSRDALVAIARSGSTVEHRKNAIEWLGLVRIGETRDVIRELVFEKGNSEIREEAILALSQLPPDEAARELIAVIERPGLDMDIRRMALFSLAQTDSDLVISYISGLLAGD